MAATGSLGDGFSDPISQNLIVESWLHEVRTFSSRKLQSMSWIRDVWAVMYPSAVEGFLRSHILSSESCAEASRLPLTRFHCTREAPAVDLNEAFARFVSLISHTLKSVSTAHVARRSGSAQDQLMSVTGLI